MIHLRQSAIEVTEKGNESTSQKINEITNALTNQNSNLTNYDLPILNSTNATQVKRWVQANENIEGKIISTYIPIDEYRFTVNYTINEQHKITGRTISLNPKFNDLYNEVGFFGRPVDTVIVYPLFTQAAYWQHGFYDYYGKICDSSCLTVSIPSEIIPLYQTSKNAYDVLRLLRYDIVTDEDVDKNPDILKKYNKVIVLHNEYVTQKEFDAITSHPNVVYLYPNSLYAKVTTDYDNNTITLVRGHGYPEEQVDNGFNWKFDNSEYEYDLQCNNWQFHVIDNGKMLDCYPTFRILLDESLLRAIAQ